MKILNIKIISAVLAASMALSVASCSAARPSAEGNSGKKISADSPWFESSVIDVEVDLDSSRQVDYTYKSLVGSDDKYIVILTSGYYSMPDDDEIDWANYDYNSYAINQISIIDRSTKQVSGNIDLNKNLGSGDYLENAVYSNGIITACYSSYNDVTYQMMRKETDIDVSTGEIINTRTSSNDNGGIERSFRIGEYRIDTMMDWSTANAAYIIFVYSADGSMRQVDIRENGKDYYDIPVILPLSETTALIPVNTDGEYVYFELNLNTLALTEADSKEYEWINLDECYSPFISSDSKVYFNTSSGISEIDLKKKTTEKVFDYSWCGISRNKLSNLYLADFSGDSFVLCGEDYSYTAFENSNESDFMIVEFTKASENPHAGKTILELYNANGYTEDAVSDAIIEFNETNRNYFIEVTDRYSNDVYDYYNVNSEDQYDKMNLDGNSKMSNQLAMDIMNGDGPDILMNVSNFGQLYNKNYLADLTPYVSNLDSDKYYTNVIEVSKVDGVLYNVPVSFCITGIHTDEKYAGASGIGFSTAEYEDFLKNTLNGDDVIVSGQPYYFAKLFNNMSDKFIVNGKADFTGPEFAELAVFVKENVREYSKSWDEMYADDSYAVYATAVGTTIMKGDHVNREQLAMLSTYYGFSSYLIDTVQLNGATALLGYPSCDGRGPVIENNISVAISARACNVDACGEFVRLLLSDEIQTKLAKTDVFVLSREAFRQGCQNAVEYYNGEGGEGLFGYDYNTLEPLQNRPHFSDKEINDVERIILSCSGMYYADADINLILIEEMPAYFSGQKDLDEVIKIAQDRVQKVLDERG